MAFARGIDGSEPIGPVSEPAGAQEQRRSARSARLGIGTLACPRCDAPIALTAGPVSPADRLHCPFCRHAGAVREFLSLAAPARPQRVEVRVVHRPRRPSRAGLS